MKMKYISYRTEISGWFWPLFTAILLLSFLRLPAREADTTIFALDDCIAAALKNNPQILASGLTVDESRVRIDEMRAGYYPTLSLSVTGGRSDGENNALGTGTARRTNMSSGLFAHYTVFQGFKTISAVNVATSNYQSNLAQHRANQEELIIIVAEAYYRLLQAERLVRVAQQSLQRAQMHLDFSNALFNAGLASRADILKAKVAQSDAELSLIRSRNARLAVQGQLNLHMGRAVQLPMKIVDDLEPLHCISDSSFLINENQFPKYLQLAFENRPELQRIEQQIKAQQSNRRLARSDYFPTISVEGSYTYAGETISDMNSSSFIGMSLNFPLFSGFARPAQVQQENFALQNLRRQQEGLRQQIGLEVWNAHLLIKEAAERVLNARVFLENARESREIAEGEYREGVGSMLDVIDAQTAFVTAEQTLIEALADYRIALAALDRAVGRNIVKEIQK